MGQDDTRKMKVKMLTNVAGYPSHVIGELVELEPRVAKAWIEEGLATAVRDEPAVERAVRA